MPGTDEAAVGKRIREARLAAGLTQDELATLTGLRQSAITRMESGQQKVPVSALIRIAEALNAPIATLTDIHDAREAEPDESVTRAEYQAVCLRVWRLEDYCKRLAGLLGAAGGVLDAAKLIEREVLNPPPKEITT